MRIIIMIKFKALNNETNTEFFGFGLSEKNIIALKKGYPIYVIGNKIESIYDYLILYGKSEETILNGLKDFIGPGTMTIKQS